MPETEREIAEMLDRVLNAQAGMERVLLSPTARDALERQLWGQVPRRRPFGSRPRTFAAWLRVIESPYLEPREPTPGEWVRRYVRHQMADVLAWVGEEVGPEPDEPVHTMLLFADGPGYGVLVRNPQIKMDAWDVPRLGLEWAALGMGIAGGDPWCVTI